MKNADKGDEHTQKNVLPLPQRAPFQGTLFQHAEQDIPGSIQVFVIVTL